MIHYDDEDTHDVPSPSEYLGASSTAASTAPSSPTPINSEPGDYDPDTAFGVPEVRMNDTLEFVKGETKGDLGTLDADTFDMKQDDFEKLDFILKKSTLYSSILCERMEENKRRQADGIAALRASQAQAMDDDSDGDDCTPRMKGGKRLRAEGDGEGQRKSKKRVKSEDLEEEVTIFPQPGLITGAKMKKYQLEGLQWMVALHQNGISGILGAFCVWICWGLRCYGVH
ncbi:hypothetical protein EYR40_009878 [Pleurotus pulmonarius]|nr:hypothetical protein EYR36_004043 [Pleurotus pulmonarius]KAF4591275.1 hypothetical protein EYR40_009878 [Pleurotus pulmonarius]